LKVLDKNLKELHIESDEIRGRWQALVSSIRRRSELKSKLSTVKQEIDRAQRRIDFAMVTYLEETHLHPLELELAQDAGEPETDSQFQIPGQINEEDIEHQLAEWTGIPISRLAENDAVRLEQLQNELQSRVVGQNRATS
jgi:ATP-dependent Clp protease ATP-binding subunit ClpB